MADAILRIKTVMDIGDAASNIGALQKGLSKLKLPDKLNSNLNKNISEFYKEYDKYQRKIAEGIKTQSDQSQAEKSLNRMKTLYSAISKELNQVTKLNIDDIIDLGSGDFKRIADEISRTVKEINKIKVDKKPFEDAKTQIESLTKSKKVTGDDGILNRMLGHIDKGELTEAKSALDELKRYAEKAAPRQVYSEKAKGMIAAPGTMSPEKYKRLQEVIAAMEAEFSKADAKAEPLIRTLNELQKELGETKAAAGKDIMGGANDFKRTVKDVEKVTDSLKRMHQEEYGFKRQTQDIDRQIQSYFGLAQMIRKVGDIARAAFNTVKELDAAMVETAVVTNFDVSDMWGMLPEYTAQANQLGSTIKDVYEAATLYFQQGLNKQQSLGLANETLKMARIGGLQAAEATNMMTAALRGFNMEINGTSAQRINDVYSELAAITAADTKEIGSAMERTASIANSANMEFETTSAFLSQMIETTREAPENLGTAMKTIIARFQEMKQDPTRLVDSEGVAMDANKIDTALKTIGVDLTNQKGEFRDLDDVFLEISEKWDSLTQGQQRYIATIAAGSRQQSRFIAMMQNHERVMELVEAANNSAGASQKQFEKTLDSMSSKLNRLKNAWNQFTMGLMNDKLIKGGIDALTKSFTVINKIIDFLGKIPPKPFEGITKSALTLATTLGMLNIGKKMTRGSVMGVAGWWKQEGGFIKNFKQGYGAGEINKVGQETAKGFSTAFSNHFKGIGKTLIPNTIASSIKGVKGASDAFKETFAGAYGKYSAGALKAGWTENIENEIRSAWSKASKGVDASVFGKQDADEYINGYINKMKSGKMNATQVARRIKGETGIDMSGQQVGQASKELEQTKTAAQRFGNAIAGAGGALQMFGMLLQSTPLAPFGAAISMVGMGISMLGSNIMTFSTVYKAQIADDVAVTKAFGIALWESFGIIAVVTAAIMALIGLYKVADALHESDKERLERMKDAAASASEAFDMAKQETSELNDALSRVEENQKAFETLAVGTAEFNDQLINSNELISELLKKYPMLNDKRYLSTDENGVMHLSKEGIKAVKDYQKEIQTHANAISLIQGADYSAEEKTQKAKQLREDADDRKLTEKQKQNKLDQADLLDKQAETEKALARVNALRTSLNNKEIQNVEALSAAYADLYDKKRTAAEAEVKKMSKRERLQAYADFHNYTYDASTKKMTNAEGTEVEYDKKAVKDEVIEQTVLLEFEEDAKTLDGILSNLDTRFSETLEKTYEGSNRAISNILGSNIETDTDLIEDILSDTSGLQKVVDSLKKEEIAAILGVTTEEVGDNIDAYKAQTVSLLTEKASNIAKAQYESYAKLSEMMARAQQGSLADASLEGNKDLIRDQIQKLTTQQATTLSTIGQTLQDQAGDEAMSAFVDKASFIYLSRSKQVAQEFNDIIEGVNWESPTSRLEAYNKMLNSTDENIQKVGQSMLSAAGEANIVGAAFDEFLGGDWLDLQENADDLKNSLGEIDGLGILKAAESSKTLKTLLDTGRVSAGGLAMALQAVDSGSISQASSAVLELLSAITKTTDAALQAHNIIENFDPGIDYSESNDFMVESAEKVKELMGDDKWGNQQLETYIKLAAGQEKWNQTYLKFHGNLKETTKALSGYATAFENGITPVFAKLAKGEGLNGKKIEENIRNSNIDEELKKKFLDGVDISIDDAGYLQFDFGDLTTEEFQKYLEVAGDIGDQAAAIMMEHLVNYNETEGAKLEANNLKARLKDPDFQKSFMTEDGKLAIDNESLNTLKGILGKENFELLAKELGFKDTEKKTAGEQLKDSSFKVVDENGKRLQGGKELAESYAKKYYEKETTGKNGKTDLAKLSDIRSLQTDMKFDFAKFIADNNAKHMDEKQAQENAWAAYQAMQKSGEPMVYKGMELSGNLKTSTELIEQLESLDEKQKWYDVGTAIAEGIMGSLSKKFPWLFPDENETPPGAPVESAPSSGKVVTKTYSKKQRKKIDKEKKVSEADETLKTINEGYGNIIKAPSQVTKTTEGQDALALVKRIEGKNQVLTTDIEKAFQVLGINTKEAMNQGLIQKSDDKVISEIKQAVKEGTAEAESSSSESSDESKDKPKDKPKDDSSSKETEDAKQAALKNISDFGIKVSEVLKPLLKTQPEGSGNQAQTKGLSSIPFQAKIADAPGAQKMMGWIKNLFAPGKKEQSGGQKQTTTEKTKEGNYTVKTEDKEVDETKKKVDELDAVVNKGGTYTITTPGAKQLTSAAKAAKALTDTKDTKTIGVKTGKLDTSSLKSAKSTINKFKPKINVGAKVKDAIDTAEAAKDKINKKKASIDIGPNFTGSWKKTLYVNEVKVRTGGLVVPGGPIYRRRGGLASNPMFKREGTDTIPAMLTPGEYVHNRKAVNYFGIDFMRKINHKDLPGALQTLGSAANGRYGRLGPKGKGGLTLTGEKGFEIAWLPSESRSMVLGAKGPQMLNLPHDAVVYTHEQSKKIIRQKSIPAGSHSGMRVGGGGGGGGSSAKKASSKKGSNKTVHHAASAVLQVAGKVSVWWENQARKVDAIQRNVDKISKAFEKELKAISKTRSGINGTLSTYKNWLNKSISANEASVNKARKELNALDKSKKSSKRTVSYEVTKKGKKGKKTTETKKGKVSLSSFIKYDKELDTYVIDQNAINKVAKKNKSKAQAIKDLAENEINDRLSKRNTALDNIEKAQEALEKLSNDVYEAFDRWEKTITRVYVTSQKLEEISKRLSIAGTQTELQFAKLEAGIIQTSEALPKVQLALMEQRDLLLSQATGKENALEAAQSEYKDVLDFTKYVNKYLKNTESTEAQEDYKAAQLAFDFLNKFNLNDDKNFNYAAAIAELNNQNYNEETNNAIKSVLDKIFEKQNSFLDAVNDAYDTQKEIYSTIEEYQSFISEFEQDLLSGIEEQAEDEIKKLDKLNSSLSKAFKELIDEVKNRLEERRRQEDNAKTESDIAKKQQRLAALRADTAGGHQVEIAQLEKEIAEAQQSYQRTLEDQLLDRLQQQGDKAEKQRQQQIDLLEAQKEIAKQTGSNLEQVKLWVQNPEANKEEIKQAWLANKNYDELPLREQQQLEDKFESEWTKYLAYSNQLPEYEKMAVDSLESLEKNVDSIASTVSNLSGGKRDAALLKAAGFTASQLRKANYSAASLLSGYSIPEIVNAGYSKSELGSAGISLDKIKQYKNQINPSTLRNAGYTAKDVSQAGYTDNQIRGAGYTAQEFSTYQPGRAGAAAARNAGYTRAEIVSGYGKTIGSQVGLADYNMRGTTVQALNGASAANLQAAINLDKNDNAIQADLANVQAGKIDINGRKKGGIINDSHISYNGRRISANKGSTLYHAAWNTKTGKPMGKWTAVPISKLTASLVKRYPKDAKQALEYAIRHQKVGSKINKSFKSLVNATNPKLVGKTYKLKNGIQATIGSNGKIYYNSGKKGVQIWDTAAGKLSLDKYNKKEFIKKAKGNSYVKKEYAQVLKANGIKGYATGGLADQTGPAWLDGTPSKPELVLNAKDTENFLALRDILEKAIGSSNSINNDYGGNMSYEININVDHINNDYDVDKIAERVKHDIVKSAGYRSVTQVRNFR